MLLRLSMAAIAALALVTPALAQSTPRPEPAVELFTGYTGFVDESLINHFALGTGVRVHLSPRVSIGPEIAYMQGPGQDRDLFLTGNLTFDVLSPRPGRTVTPFLVIGGGLMRHSDSIGAGTFSSTEGAWTGGGGVRAWINDRAYGVVEFRMGWEPHMRVTGGVGIVLGR
jgi:hypothetical protein